MKLCGVIDMFLVGPKVFSFVVKGVKVYIIQICPVLLENVKKVMGKSLWLIHVQLKKLIKENVIAYFKSTK
jgi:hypothetical protein